MDAQRQNHGGRLRALIGNLVTRANLHRKSLRSGQTEPSSWLLRITRQESSCLGHTTTARGAAAIVAGQNHRPLPVPASGCAATLTATFMARWSDAVPIHVPCTGIASRD